MILIGEIETLARLFGRDFIPPAVLRELQHPRTPPAVAEWARNPPGWLEVRTPEADLHLAIGPGEDEAISLAIELGHATLLADDRKACLAAKGRGLTVLGTVAILALADEARLLEFEEAIARLRATSFYLDELVLEPIMGAVRARKRQSA